jgi:hypothetical protein
MPAAQPERLERTVEVTDGARARLREQKACGIAEPRCYFPGVGRRCLADDSSLCDAVPPSRGTRDRG